MLLYGEMSRGRKSWGVGWVGLNSVVVSLSLYCLHDNFSH